MDHILMRCVPVTPFIDSQLGEAEGLCTNPVDRAIFVTGPEEEKKKLIKEELKKEFKMTDGGK
ncbi:hypothetical protein HK102_000664, partial [Quaeritorhiza haematococci]